MARNEVFISAPPQAVFAVLSDPGSYGHWVVGSSEIRTSDADWPAPGAAFAYTAGVGPLRLRDRTIVIDAEPPVMLKLRVRARPLPNAEVTLYLQPEGDGTRVTMIESPANRFVSLATWPWGHAVVSARNREALQRLKELAEGTRLREPQPVDG
jgi:uncharacterized protein YndB with AHSA1/START domain